MFAATAATPASRSVAMTFETLWPLSGPDRIRLPSSLPRQGRPLQSWKTFLCNHGKNIASIDLIVVPTIAFRRLSLGQQLGHIMRENGVPCLRRVDDIQSIRRRTAGEILQEVLDLIREIDVLTLVACASTPDGIIGRAPVRAAKGRISVRSEAHRPCQ